MSRIFFTKIWTLISARTVQNNSSVIAESLFEFALAKPFRLGGTRSQIGDK